MSLSIEITSDLPVLAGSTIVGSVVCNFSKPTKVKAMQVLFHGDEKTEKISEMKDLVSGSNELVDIEKGLIDSETEVPSGTSKHIFKIEVPQRLPSSFKHYNGEIKYFLKATIKRHLRVDMTATKVVELMAYVDLNTYLPALQIKAEYSTDRLVSNCCGLSRGRILLTAVISKRLFLKGETIFLDLNIVNLSGVRVKKVYSRIMKTVTIYFKNPYPNEEIYRDFLAKSGNFPGVKGYDEVSYNLFIKIPNDIFIPNFRYSKLFKITHQLQIIAKMSGCHTAMVLQFKIYLGHIPVSSPGLQLENRNWKGPYIRDPNTASASSVGKS
ncbi:arrestin domain-containing protein 3-like [Coccinella septempunctata]|uniref:arrestin domain-containing protein 3-like n=1 Tax=Coccinella septempunctata TaxID=41139 RepID=UPI001D0693F6|nr:arrestin domain-containing protein 3-like [Coccinella septempunctata]